MARYSLDRGERLNLLIVLLITSLPATDLMINSLNIETQTQPTQSSETSNFVNYFIIAWVLTKYISNSL